jgi:hypothetical protein
MTRAMKVSPRVLPAVGCLAVVVHSFSRLCHITQTLLKLALVRLLGGILGRILHVPSAVVHDTRCPPLAMPLRSNLSLILGRLGECRADVVAHPVFPCRDSLALLEEVFKYNQHGQPYKDRELTEKAGISGLSLQRPNLGLGMLAHLFNVPSPSSARCFLNNLKGVTMIGCLGITLARARKRDAPRNRALAGYRRTDSSFVTVKGYVPRRIGPLFERGLPCLVKQGACSESWVR